MSKTVENNVIKEKLLFMSKTVENNVVKEETALYEQFLLFPQCFRKTSTADM